MLSFASSLGSDSDPFAIFVMKKFDFKDRKNFYLKKIIRKLIYFLNH